MPLPLDPDLPDDDPRRRWPRVSDAYSVQAVADLMAEVDRLRSLNRALCHYIAACALADARPGAVLAINDAHLTPGARLLATVDAMGDVKLTVLPC